MNTSQLNVARTWTATPKPRTRVPWLEISLLLALTQLLLAGYRLGVGNQAIQIPFLKRLADPSLYTNDAMVSGTLSAYPSFFFAALAPIAQKLGIEPTYFVLHLASAFAVMAGVTALGAAMYRGADRQRYGIGLVAALLLVAGHHRALAGEELYSPGFTHTFAVLGPAVFALALFFRRRDWLAFAVAGLLFNFHALTAAYLAAMLGAALLLDWRAVGWRGLLRCGIAFVATAAPTAIAMAAHPQHFGEQWLKLMWLRSADHSFPSTWWAAGNLDLPRFVLVAGIAALAAGFTAPLATRRRLLGMIVGAAALFIVGFVFTELLPSSLVVRAQLFRASRLVMVLLLVQIAHGVVMALRAALGRRTPLPLGIRIMEAAFALATIACLALPPLLRMLPWLLAAGVCVALIAGRLSWRAAIGAGAAGLIALAAWRNIHFPVPGLGEPWALADWSDARAASTLFIAPAITALCAAAMCWSIAQTRVRLAVTAATLLLVPLVAIKGYREFGPAPVDDWTALQRWAREHTPADAVFLTPTQPGGFRVWSDRAVVCEWRDGTQLYFSGNFTQEWDRRLKQLQPGMVASPTGGIVDRGRSIDDLSDAQLVKLAQEFSAGYIVLSRPNQERRLEPIASAGRYTLYAPRLVVAATMPAPQTLQERWAASEQFMQDVVWPNIERHRKSDVALRVVDQDARAVYDVPFNVRQTRQLFRFSCSLPFFVPPPRTTSHGDFYPQAVDPRELERFLEIFNYSMIPFSAKWMYVEPADGKPFWDDMDRYVDWCVKHDIRIEYHFMSGYEPAWVLARPPEEQKKAFMRHVQQLIDRYGTKIDSWQVVNEQHQLSNSPDAFRLMKQSLPNAMLGYSDCAKFYPEGRLNQEADQLRGLPEVRWLKSQKAPLDFFALHGHRPFGVWPDPAEMYRVIDAFAKEGVRVHITEFFCPIVGQRITGPIREGEWTPQAQAEYYPWFYTVCFSHPEVDMVNLWGSGPNTWQGGSGLVDADYKPRPAFNTMKDLIKNKFTTKTSGVLALDGTASFRGFHGTYEIELKWPDGKTSKATFDVKPGQTNNVRLIVNRATGSVAQAK